MCDGCKNRTNFGQRRFTMKYTIKTEGMGCPHCVKRVTKAMQELNAEIERVEINNIIVSSDKAEAEIRKSIEDLGFKVISVAIV